MAETDPNKNKGGKNQTETQGVDLAGIDAEALIEAFGGIRPMATKLEIAVSTVQGWKNRNHIPESRFEDILSAALAHDVDLSSLQAQSTASDEGQDESEASDPKDDTMPSPFASEDETPKDPTTQESETSVAENSVADTNDGHDKEASAQPEQTDSKSEEPTPTKSSSSGLAVLAIILSLSSGGAILTQPYWQASVDQILKPRIEQLAPAFAQARDARERASEQRLQDLLAPLQENFAAEVESLQARLSDLENRPTDVARLEDIQDVEADIADLAIRLDQLISLSQSIDTAEVEPSEMIAEDTSLDAVSQTETVAPVTEAPVVVEQSGRTLAALVQFEDRLTQMEEGLSDRLSMVPQDVEQATQRNLEIVNSRMDAISARLSLTENRLDDDGSGNPMDNQAAREAAILLAVGQLETVALTGERYTEALESLESLTIDLPEFTDPIALLKQNTETGLVTRTEIARYFAGIASDATQLADAKPAESWQDKTLANLQSLFSLRRIGDGPDASPVSVAEAALVRDDLRSAIDAMIPLAARSDNIANWVDFAESRLQSENALRSLRGLALELMSSTVRRQLANSQLEKMGETTLEEGGATQ